MHIGEQDKKNSYVQGAWREGVKCERIERIRIAKHMLGWENKTKDYIQ